MSQRFGFRDAKLEFRIDKSGDYWYKYIVDRN